MKLKFVQDMDPMVAKKIVVGIFEISHIFKMTTIFRPKTAIFKIFGLKMAAILKICEISKKSDPIFFATMGSISGANFSFIALSQQN